jgi:hypothetical protein
MHYLYKVDLKKIKVMKKLDELVKDKSYIHVSYYGNIRTTFRYVGKTESSRHTIVILEGKEEGVKSFLIPTDQIIEY